jgi:hypothetical protein
VLEAEDRPRSIHNDRPVGFRCKALGLQSRDLGIVIGPDLLAIKHRGPKARRKSRPLAIEDDFAKLAHRAFSDGGPRRFSPATAAPLALRANAAAASRRLPRRRR